MKAITQWTPLIKQARLRASLSQRELAARAGTVQSVVARIERGQTSPTVDTIERLLLATGFDLDLQLVPRPAPDPLIEAYKRDIDRSLLKRNLEKRPDERLRSLQALSRLADEAHRAGAAARRKP